MRFSQDAIDEMITRFPLAEVLRRVVATEDLPMPEQETPKGQNASTKPCGRSYS